MAPEAFHCTSSRIYPLQKAKLGLFLWQYIQLSFLGICSFTWLSQDPFSQPRYYFARTTIESFASQPLKIRAYSIPSDCSSTGVQGSIWCMNGTPMASDNRGLQRTCNGKNMAHLMDRRSPGRSRNLIVTDVPQRSMMLFLLFSIEHTNPPKRVITQAGLFIANLTRFPLLSFFSAIHPI